MIPKYKSIFNYDLQEIVDDYQTTKSYVVNDKCYHNNVLYICTASTTGAFDESKWNFLLIKEPKSGEKLDVDRMRFMKSVDYHTCGDGVGGNPKGFRYLLSMQSVLNSQTTPNYLTERDKYIGKSYVDSTTGELIFYTDSQYFNEELELNIFSARKLNYLNDMMERILSAFYQRCQGYIRFYLSPWLRFYGENIFKGAYSSDRTVYSTQGMRDMVTTMEHNRSCILNYKFQIKESYFTLGSSPTITATYIDNTTKTISGICNEAGTLLLNINNLFPAPFIGKFTDDTYVDLSLSNTTLANNMWNIIISSYTLNNTTYLKIKRIKLHHLTIEPNDFFEVEKLSLLNDGWREQGG